MWVQQIARHWPAPCPKKSKAAPDPRAPTPGAACRSWCKRYNMLRPPHDTEIRAQKQTHTWPRARNTAQRQQHATSIITSPHPKPHVGGPRQHVGRVLTRWARRAQSSTPKSQSIDRWSAAGRFSNNSPVCRPALQFCPCTRHNHREAHRPCKCVQRNKQGAAFAKPLDVP